MYKLIVNLFLITIFLFSCQIYHCVEGFSGEFDQLNDFNSGKFSDQPLGLSEISSRRTKSVKKSLNNFNYTLSTKWPITDKTLGQISAVDIDSNGNIVIFHRGDHIWNSRSFDFNNRYQLASEGPISIQTVITINPINLTKISAWGRNRFYLPHGLTIDSKGFVWLTDVALHQVFKFPSGGSEKPLMVLGKEFTPGNDNEHFCKPTSVAIDSRSGDFYVADGYCNSRIIRFSANGQFLNQWGHQDELVSFSSKPAPSYMNIPHKIVLIEEQNLTCVADREHGRIQCFTTPNGDFKFMINHKEFAGKLFSIAYSPYGGGVLFAINGANFLDHFPVKSFLFNLTTHELLTSFGSFKTPHDIAASSDAKNVYIVEIGPNEIWRFEREVPKETPHQENSSLMITKSPVATQIGISDTLSSNIHSSQSPDSPLIPSPLASLSNTSLIVLLIIPIMLVLFLAFLITFRRNGRPSNYSPLQEIKGWVNSYKATKSESRLDLGRILSDPTKSGFNKLAMEDSDNENGATNEEGHSESEVEEFNVTSVRKI